MRPAFVSLAVLAAFGIAAPAQADPAGRVQVKAFATAVLPDGQIKDVKSDAVGLPADLQTRANDNYVPTLAVEYFFTSDFSVETICCLTQHDVDATSGMAGAELAADAKLIPATVQLKYHFGFGGAVKPYVGAGATYFLFIDDEPGTAAIAAGADDFSLDDSLGVALQAGVDVPLNSAGLALSLDAKRYFVSTDANWYAGATKVIETRHRLDPWLLSAGLAYRF
ncbi:OmpW/AlkL family protein [Altericroceibacterium xinjiangense]|uniref:OmpW/AlkL family protein n=1 Tax=Altericroceibacterium xinjiangense TaxID=762261 RepID=UPI000F7F37CC|nr:OmpW family outer membrane protein [Altericroceibacterium xinjiangense]